MTVHNRQLSQPNVMPKITFLIASARENGNSEQLARIAAESLPEKFEQKWISLKDLPLPPFEDLRHGDAAYQTPTGNALEMHNITWQSDGIVFVTPLYWYSVPAPLKLYLDHWSHWMRIAALDFKNKMRGKDAWAISCSAGPTNEAEPMFTALRLSANYMNMNWRGHVLGNGTAAGDVMNDTQAIENARKLFNTLT